jgi:hypothetical protein
LPFVKEQEMESGTGIERDRFRNPVRELHSFTGRNATLFFESKGPRSKPSARLLRQVVLRDDHAPLFSSRLNLDDSRGGHAAAMAARNASH